MPEMMVSPAEASWSDNLRAVSLPYVDVFLEPTMEMAC